MLQLVIFLPLSMVRDMAKLGGTALVADFFILLGLGYLYYYNFLTIASEGISDIVSFNPKDWTLLCDFPFVLRSSGFVELTSE